VWPSWSPDGERILVTSGSFSSPRLWTVRADGSAPEQVSDVVGEEGAWSPNGARIAFASTRDGSPGARDPVDWNEEIYVMRADGSGLTRLTRTAGNEHWPPAWSPDGRHIAFTSDGCTAKSDILITDVRGSVLLNATDHPANDLFPAWHK
jgi:Tol biopolymer transport system component